MNIYRLVAVPLLLASFSGFAQPTEKELAEEVSDNMSSAYIRCAAYFTIATRGLLKSNEAELANKYKEASKAAMLLGIKAAQESRSNEMAFKVSEARYTGYLKSMLETIEHSYSNIALLTAKYTDNCTSAMTDPAAFKRKWNKEVNEKYSPKKQ